MTDPLTTNRERLDIPQILGRVAFFSECPPESLAQVAAATQLRRLAKGTLLFQKDDLPKGLFIVVFGQIKEAVRSPQGGEKIIEIFGPRQSFGETAMLLDRPYPSFAESLEDSLLILIPKGIVASLLETDTAFVKRMLASLSRRIHALVADIESYSLRTPEQRVVDYLAKDGFPQPQDRCLQISLPATKVAIASRLGMTPETLSRILASFAQAGLITVQGRNLSIPDLNRLRGFTAKYHPKPQRGARVSASSRNAGPLQPAPASCLSQLYTGA